MTLQSAAVLILVVMSAGRIWKTRHDTPFPALQLCAYALWVFWVFVAIMGLLRQTRWGHGLAVGVSALPSLTFAIAFALDVRRDGFDASLAFPLAYLSFFGIPLPFLIAGRRAYLSGLVS